MQPLIHRTQVELTVRLRISHCFNHRVFRVESCVRLNDYDGGELTVIESRAINRGTIEPLGPLMHRSPFFLQNIVSLSLSKILAANSNVRN